MQLPNLFEVSPPQLGKGSQCVLLGFEVGRPGMAPQPIEYVGVSLPNSLSSFGVPMSPPIGIEPWSTFYLWAGGRGSVVTRGHFGSSVCGPWRGRHFDFPSRPCPLMTDHTLHAHVTDRPPTHVPCDEFKHMYYAAILARVLDLRTELATLQ